MIIDRIPIPGQRAYLQANGQVDIAQASGLEGVFEKILEGEAVEVDALSLLIEGEKLYSRLSQANEKPLISLRITKELFPGLFADPNATRVHSIAGYEDFQRGTLAGIRAMDVEGVPTLVATGTGGSSWSSPVYRVPRPTTFVSAAWDMALSRLTPKDVVFYDLSLEVWTNALDAGVTPGTIVQMTASDTDAQAPRFEERLRFGNGRPVQKVMAYRVHFRAKVSHDTRLEERQVGMPEDTSIGAPLLRGVNILEDVQSAYDFTSLHELLAAADSYDFLDAPEPNRLLLRLSMPASLRADETMQIEIAPNVFKRFEAKLEGELRLRPPHIEKSIS